MGENFSDNILHWEVDFYPQNVFHTVSEGKILAYEAHAYIHIAVLSIGDELPKQDIERYLLDILLDSEYEVKHSTIIEYSNPKVKFLSPEASIYLAGNLAHEVLPGISFTAFSSDIVLSGDIVATFMELQGAHINGRRIN